MSAERTLLNRRLALLVLSTLAGIAVGLSGDLLTDVDPFSSDDVVVALMFSQMAVTVGGFAVPVNALPGISREFFLYGGLLFYPVYGLLTWQWFRRGSAWLGLAIFLWSAQGFFHLICRFRMLMSA